MSQAIDNTITLDDADCMDTRELTTLTVEQLRGLYKRYRKCALYGIYQEDVDKQLEAKNPVTPVEHVEAIRSVEGKCDRCRGTGVYGWGACVNGRMTHSGVCFRCGGKGKINVDDCRRNYGYDGYAIRQAFRQMCGE